MKTFPNLSITIATIILVSSCTKDTLAPRAPDDPAQAAASTVVSATQALQDDAIPAASTASATQMLDADTPPPSTVAQGSQLLGDDAGQTGNGNPVRPDVVYSMDPINSTVAGSTIEGYTPLEPVPDAEPSASDPAPL